jgi:hypothetical protein
VRVVVSTRLELKTNRLEKSFNVKEQWFSGFNTWLYRPNLPADFCGHQMVFLLVLSV